ncbi:MAG TPA: hypothetical protein VE591_02685 [Candidatus Acidoferrum sp.]|nr:hypothetical protein [Candidatus Acidoferrum sp.]
MLRLPIVSRVEGLTRNLLLDAFLEDVVRVQEQTFERDADQHANFLNVVDRAYYDGSRSFRLLDFVARRADPNDSWGW